MNINTYNHYSPNQYSPGRGYLEENRTSGSINSAQGDKNQLDGNPSQKSSSPSSVEPLPGQPSSQTSPQTSPEDSTATDTQGTEESTSPSEQQPMAKKAGDSQLTQSERQLIMELEQIDTEVRSHEMAHMAAGGGLITSGASFTYKRGPDGNNYAVAGEVGIDTAEIPGDPQATVQKMQQVRSAAMAPANPSPQDLKVASQAAALAAKASSELTMLQAKQQAAANETQAFGNLKQASDSYTRVNNLPEKDTSTFKLAV